MPGVLSQTCMAAGGVGDRFSLNRDFPALIVKANRGAIHHGAVGIARTLGRLDIPVYAIVDDRLAPLARSRYVTKAFIWRNWPCEKDLFVRELREVAGAIRRKAVIFPIDDLAAALVAENAEVLGEFFLAPKIPPGLPRRMADKAILYDLCRRNHIACAETAIPGSEREISEFADRVGFPFMIKATSQWAPINGRASTLIVRDRRAMQAFCEGAAKTGMVPMILQEYLPGEDWIYHGYRNDKSGVCIGFTGRKLLSYPLSAGSTVVGFSKHDEALARQSEKLLEVLGFSGIVDMDWRYDPRDGQFKILDCNPRVGQNFRMFSDERSLDVVRAQHLDLTGGHLAHADMIEGRMYIVEPYYLYLRLSGQCAGALRHRPGGRELAWLAADDPWPAAAMGLRLSWRFVLRELRRAGHGLRSAFKLPS
jgi:D-aspartate ligase